MKISLKFSSGAELLLDKNKLENDAKLTEVISVDVDDTIKTMGDLINWIADRYMTDKRHLFVDKRMLRPGILVIINDAYDWSLKGQDEYVLEDGDLIEFISMLHGG